MFARELSAGKKEMFLIQLPAGVYVKVVAVQHGVDLAIKILSVDGKQLEEADSPTGREGSESLSFVTSDAGRYQIVIESLEQAAPVGRYELRIVEQKPATQLEQDLARADSFHRRAVMQGMNDELKEALILAEEAHAAMQSMPTAFAAEKADYAFHLAQLYRGANGDAKRAKPLLEDALRIRETMPNKISAEVAAILSELGKVHLSLTQFNDAEEAFRRALDIYKQTSGLEGIETALAQNDLADVYREKGRYAEALLHAQQARASLEKTSLAASVEVAPVLVNLADLYRLRAEYTQAEPLYQRAIKLFEEALGKDHLNVTLAQQKLAALYIQTANYERAETLLLTREKLEKKLPPDHPDVVRTAMNLARIHMDKGNYAEAETIYRRYLEIREKKLAPDHPLIASSLQNLASVAHERGDYVQAEQLYQRALTIRLKDATSAEQPETAFLRSNLGNLYAKKGDYQQAGEHLQISFNIREKVLGPQHPDLALTLNQIAAVAISQGQLASAESRLKQALAIQERAFEREHPDVAVTLARLAGIWQQERKFSAAEDYYQRALNINRKHFGAEHPLAGRILHQMGNLYREQGKTAQAESSYQQARQMQEKMLGAQHPAVAALLSDQARLAQAQGRKAEAAALLQRSLTSQETALRRNLATGSERQKQAYLATFKATLNQALAFDAKNPQLRAVAFSALLGFKGRGLDEMANTITRLRNNVGPEEKQLFDQFLTTRSQLSSLTLREPEATAAVAYQERLKKLNAQLEQIESELSRRSALFRVNTEAVTPELVQRMLPTGTALLEFGLYQPESSDPTRPLAAHYVAYVLPPAGKFQRVDIGAAQEIDQTVHDLREALRDPARADVIRLARRTHEKVFRPLHNLLGNAHNVLLSPEGSLNLLPFAALVNERGQYLVNQYTFSYLTSGRDLLRLQVKQEATATALVFAAPEFSALPSGEISAELRDLFPGKKLLEMAATNPQKSLFTPLPGTAGEAQALRALLPQATILTGIQATETALKKVRRPQLLHIATHGFFLNEKANFDLLASRGLKATARVGQRDLEKKYGLPKVYLPASTPEQTVNPLLRSGLALAGANVQQKGESDGILTALEAAALDLQGTRLVVLSACDTGVGEVFNGEGVYGLRRSLVLAGAESLVMSLWPVDDKATRELMTVYYQRLLQGAGRGAGLQQVQRQMLRSKQHQHPFYWAAFIHSGEWANLQGVR